jgi:hypothetical protein
VTVHALTVSGWVGTVTNLLDPHLEDFPFFFPSSLPKVIGRQTPIALDIIQELGHKTAYFVVEGIG